MVRLALDPDAAAMSLNHLPCYGETEAHAAFAGGLAGSGAHKRREEPFLVKRRNAGAFITHGENYFRAFSMGHKPDALAGFGMFNSITQQVDKNLL